MKKITVLFLLFSFSIFAQNEKSLITDYLSKKKSALNLTDVDISDFTIESVGNSEFTGITNYYIKQRYLGIEIFNSVSNVWVKNGQVINFLNSFQSNLTTKIINQKKPLKVVEAFSKLSKNLSLNVFETSILQSTSENEFKLSNGKLKDEPILAELVYHFDKKLNNLILAWDFCFYSQDHTNFWSIRVDASDGKILEKHDMVISCNFGNNEVLDAKNDLYYFDNLFFKKSNLLQTNGGSYRVVPFNYESPNHSPRQLISNPENSITSPKGWHDTNTIGGNNAANKYQITRGNNVWAQSDYTNTNPFITSTSPLANGYSPNGGTLLNFDFPYGGTGVVANTYIDAAVTNLFYMNNIMHDVWSFQGFNEANGNFQKTNYNFASGANDFVFADAQDNGVTTSKPTPQFNNANFSTPVDGGSGRMQMFLWTATQKKYNLLEVISPETIVGNYDYRQNSFSPGHVDLPIAPASLQSELVLYDDGTPELGSTDNADACSAAINASAINGKIVLIRRSLSTALGGNPCNFVVKVKNAQNAGAIAVILYNNVSTDPTSGTVITTPLGMVGADSSITIPAVAVTFEIGQKLTSKLLQGVVNIKLQLPSDFSVFINADGDFDNSIIAHEYGHGISTRLAGGRNVNNCLENYDQMGEGWSDWFSLMMQMKLTDTGVNGKPMATFALNDVNDGFGLRSYKYSTDMTINPLTYVKSNSPIPDDPNSTSYRYVSGDFWATCLYDLTWAYIAKYGYDDNKYTGDAGNNKIMKLVIDGLKLQPCSPTVIDARDALFAADQYTTGGQDYCMIAEVFRRRGVGKNASAGSNEDCNDQVEDFTAFDAGANCVLSVDYFNNQELFSVYPNPTNGSLNIRINNYSGIVNFTIVDMNGRVVSKIENKDFNIENEINISNLQSGIYILKVNGDGINFTEKIIKN